MEMMKVGRSYEWVVEVEWIRKLLIKKMIYGFIFVYYKYLILFLEILYFYKKYEFFIFFDL